MMRKFLILPLLLFSLLCLFALSMQSSAMMTIAVGGGGAPAAADTFPDNDGFGGALSSDWTQLSGDSADITTSGGSANGDTPGTFAMAWWNKHGTLTSNQGYACIRLSGAFTGSNNFAGPCLAITDGSGDSVCALAGGDSTSYNIHGFSNTDASVSDTASSGAHTWTAGNYVGIQRSGNKDFEMFYSTDGVTWNSIVAISSTELETGTYPALGYPGIFDSGNDVNIDCWEAGNESLPTGSACCTNN